MNEKTGKQFDIAGSVSHQLPFFSCMNIMLRKEYQRDIAQYLYCQEFNIPPFPGTYGQQPKKWIEKINIIKPLIKKLEIKQQQKLKENNNGI